MSAAASVQLDRAAINRANSHYSTGPRTAAGKQRSSRNALRHGLTAQSVVVPSEDQQQYQQLCREFFDEYQPATTTEAAMVQQLADTTWRLNRIRQLEDSVLADDSLPSQTVIEQLGRLGLYSSRLSRQFLNTVNQLRQIQDHRRHRQQTPQDPADNGFVFSAQQTVERACRADTPVGVQTCLPHSTAAFDAPPRSAPNL